MDDFLFPLCTNMTPNKRPDYPPNGKNGEEVIRVFWSEYEASTIRAKSLTCLDKCNVNKTSRVFSLGCQEDRTNEKLQVKLCSFLGNAASHIVFNEAETPMLQDSSLSPSQLEEFSTEPEQRPRNSNLLEGENFLLHRLASFFFCYAYRK